MIRILAASLSAAVLAATSLPVSAQPRSKGLALRAAGSPALAAKRFAAPKRTAAPRRFRSFNPPSPVGQPKSPPRAFSRGLTPPSPGPKTAPHYIGPQAPTGGQNFVSRFDSVPPSLPVPLPSQSSPTAAPTVPIAQETATVPQQPVPQADLQAPIPETVAATSAPAAGEEKRPAEVVQVVRHVHEVRVVYVPVAKAQKVIKRKRVVHVPERVYVPHRVYRPRVVYAGSRIRFGFGFGRGFRRW